MLLSIPFLFFCSRLYEVNSISNKIDYIDNNSLEMKGNMTVFLYHILAMELTICEKMRPTSLATFTQGSMFHC